MPGRTAPGGGVVVGIGTRRGARIGDLRLALGEGLTAAGARTSEVVAIVTVEAKRDEPALLELAELLGVPLRPLPADLLARQPVPNPSAVAQRLVGTGSVAEAAVLAFGAELLRAKHAARGITIAIGRLPVTASAHRSQSDDLAEDFGFKDLTHHGDAEVGPGLVDLAVNVRANAPDWLRTRLHDAVDHLAAYPNPTEATEAVAARHARPIDQVLLTAGAAEAFVLLARALAPRRAVVIHPQFTEPEAALNAAGHSVQRVHLRPPFTLAKDLVRDDADLVIVGNPTNPTSVLHPAQTLLALARPGRVLVVDEAFMDAIPGEPESLAGHPGRPAPAVSGLVVVRSLTKTWGLAGLRIGYLLGDPDVLAAARAAQPRWSVGSIALEAAIAGSTPQALAEAERIAVRAIDEREYLLGLLAGLAEVDRRPALVQVGAPPRAPFVLLRVFGPDPAGVHQRLRTAGWAVRRADTFPGLGAGWLRVAVRDRVTSAAFVAALGQAIRVTGDPPPGIDLRGNDLTSLDHRREPT